MAVPSHDDDSLEDLIHDLFGDDDEDGPSSSLHPHKGDEEEDRPSSSLLLHEGDEPLPGLQEAVQILPGLHQVKGFLPPDKQRHLRSLIEQEPWFKAGFNQSMRFGDLPPWALLLGQRVSQVLTMQQLAPPHILGRSPLFDQMIVNLYRPGEGIARHVDLARFEDGIVSVSLGDPVVMRFRPHISDTPNQAKPMPAADSNQAKPMPAADSNQAKPMPAAESNQAKPMPAADSNQAKPMPAADSNQAKPMPAAESNQAKPMPAADSNQAKPMPVAESNQAKPMPAADSNQAKPMPADESNQAKPMPDADNVANQAKPMPVADNITNSRQPDMSSITNPDVGITNPDMEIKNPDMEITNPDVEITNHDTDEVQISKPDMEITNPEVKITNHDADEVQRTFAGCAPNVLHEVLVPDFQVEHERIQHGHQPEASIPVVLSEDDNSDDTGNTCFSPSSILLKASSAPPGIKTELDANKLRSLGREYKSLMASNMWHVLNVQDTLEDLAALMASVVCGSTFELGGITLRSTTKPGAVKNGSLAINLDGAVLKNGTIELERGEQLIITGQGVHLHKITVVGQGLTLQSMTTRARLSKDKDKDKDKDKENADGLVKLTRASGIVLKDCALVVKSSAATYALCVEQDSSATLDNCTITGSSRGTGILAVGAGVSIIAHGCSVQGCKKAGVAALRGGSIMCEYRSLTQNEGCGVQLTRCDVLDNKGYGVAFFEGATGVLDDCKTNLQTQTQLK
eukprot:gene11985-15079_t